ncbi:Golgi apparatus membrane protein TVP38 [Suillus subalutaceus]|uniref:Golgi apparatus membrane protein TVP38 n=1 Tax=Suillus subalutaceus TaxID=48586 RepID=UPI001B8732F2|nr:Golgi apparatus membrane protein TVP38 [Suillus subalutaceus]KAG1856673.1 Golgi apparatus membrane protein TVP38 [Suillus subalutaceus]
MLPTPVKAARFLKRLVRSPSLRYLVRKPLIWVIVFFYVCLAAFILAVTPVRITQFMYDISQDLRSLPYGYMLLIVAMIITSFPPFIGHGTLLHMFGFTYGMWGFFPAAVGTMAASTIVFVTLRMMFGKRLRLRTSTNQKWQALEAVIRSRGMPLIILIRMSSLVPWAWSNSLFASIASVSFLRFFIATLFVFPKVWVNVFIGFCLARLSDSKQRNRTKFFNGFLIIIGSLSSVLASSLIYYSIRKEIKRLRESAERDEIPEEEFEATEEMSLSCSAI